MKLNLFFPTLISVVASLCFASIGATYAWYQYRSYVSMNFGGTSIEATKIFQVGLVSDVALDCNKYGLEYERVDGRRVYWVNGSATEKLCEYYLETNGYGTKYLNGVTSGKYSYNQYDEYGRDTFSLKRAPIYCDNYAGSNFPNYDLAKKNDYLHFSLAFRTIIINDESESVSTKKSGIKLTSFKFQHKDNDLNKAVRVHFSNADSSSAFIFNPSSIQDGEDEVGGVLDLCNNGTYDTFTFAGDDYEYIYGESESLGYKSEKTTDGAPLTLSGGDGDCFNAEHVNGAYAIDEDKTVWSTSNYCGSDSVILNNKIISTNEASGIAYFSMDIYLEGWSHAFTNSVLDKAFGCSMEFESI